jgi:anti-repressor protein
MSEMKTNNELGIYSVYEGLTVKYTDKGEKVVDARDLHQFLGLKRQFADWIKTWISKDMWEENIDYSIASRQRDGSTEPLSANRVDYILTLDMAKELCMLSETEQGKKMRKYFIEIERQFIETKQRDELEFKGKFLRENQEVLLPETKENLQKEIHALLVGGVYVRNRLEDMVDRASEGNRIVIVKQGNKGLLQAKITEVPDGFTF